MAELEARLSRRSDARARLIVTDGVFSMDGIIADLPAICDLAERHDALVMVDDSHAVGFIGARGAGTPERCGVEGRVHLVSGTFGKALGGASGGYVAGPKPFVDLLRQRARPYLFSNALAPSITAATLEALDLIAEGADSARRARAQRRPFPRRARGGGLHADARRAPDHPGDDRRCGRRRTPGGRAATRGVYVTAFSYPVVPQGKARIRTQMNAAHSLAELDRTIAAFAAAGREIGAIA